MILTYYFELFTINGIKVNEREFTVETGENNFTVSTNNLGSGVYFYRLLKADAEVAVGKVIKL